MAIVLAILQGLTGLAFLGAGGMKVATAKEKLAENMAWVNDFSENQVRLIGIAEVLGGLALLITLFVTGNATLLLLGGIAGICLAILMGGAVYTHIRLNENNLIAAPAVLGVLALISAYILLV